MANTSIKNAFERMWQHIVAKFATKDDLNNIDYPVDSVNGKTGNVTLSASDVGALPVNEDLVDVNVDTITTLGSYKLVYPTGTGLLSYGLPFDSGVTWLNLLVLGNETRVTQIASFPFSHQRVAYIRYKHDAGWSAWEKIYTSGNLTPEDIGAAVTDRVITSANTTTVSGMYRIQQADDVPSDCRYGQLLVMCHHSADTIAQIAIAHGSPKAYIRTATGMSNGVVSTWSDWIQIYTTANKPTASDVGARPNTWLPTHAEIGAAKYEFINNGTIRTDFHGSDTGFAVYLNPTDPPQSGAWFFVQRFACEGNILVIVTTITNEMYISSKPYGADWSGWSELATTNNTVPTSRTVNGKALSSDITLSASDVGARPNTWMPTPTEIGAAIGIGSLGGADANTATTSGMYRLQTEANIPSGAYYGQLIVVHGNGDTIAQVAFDYSASRMWVRTGNPSDVGGGGGWNAWKRVITEDSFVLDGGTLRITI